MKSRIKNWISGTVIALSIGLAAATTLAKAQTPARLVGTIASIGGGTLTVKTDQGQSYQVEVSPSASLKRIAPGQKDLTSAEAIQLSDLNVGDRALVKLDPDAPAGTMHALQIVAMKQSDLALKQQKDREDWQRRGVGGLVKSVDPASGTIVLSSGFGATARTVSVHTTNTTKLKRYAPTSVRFDEALPAPIDSIRAGDQLRARGNKNAEGTEIEAEEVVSGSFRNISGTISSIDATASTLVVKDLATKKSVIIHVTKDAQMRRLPERMAQMLAMRLKGTATGSSNGWGGNAQSAAGGAGPTQRGGSGQWSAGGGQGSGNAGSGASGVGNGQGPAQWGDPQQMLSRAPEIQLADLKKGEAVMLVSSDGASEVTAITLLTGVEPLLEAPAASQNLLSNWSMNSNAAESAVQ